MYRPVPNEDLKKLTLEKYDMLVMFSPTSITSLYYNYPNFEQGKLRIAAYGKTTADAILDKGLSLHMLAPTPALPTITSALDAYFEEAK